MARTESNWVEISGSYLRTPWAEGRDILINGTDKYLNFGSISGSSGYGFRDNGGVMQVKNSSGAWANFSTGGSAHTIQDEGTPFTQRGSLNFVGAGVTVTDDAGNDRTVVTIPGGGAGTDTLQDVTTRGSTTTTDIEITDATKGLIVKSANGTRWRINITNNGELTAVSL